MEIDIRTGALNSIDAIRFSESAVLKNPTEDTITVNANDGRVLVSIQKASRDALITALMRSKLVFP